MMTDIDEKIFRFNVIVGSVLILFGLLIVTKNIFFSEIQNGYELVFGVQFITAGIFLVHGKFKGFRNMDGMA